MRYEIDSRMKPRLVVRADENAVAMRGNATGHIGHSERGLFVDLAGMSPGCATDWV